MSEICERAIERVRKLEDKEKCLDLCFKYLVCPKCGEDIEKTSQATINSIPSTRRYMYQCTDCNWREFRAF